MLSRRELLLSSLALPLAAQKKPAAERPNVVLIVTSGVGAWMLGCYGNKEVKTPSLDRMAAAGARFVAAFSATGTAAEGRTALTTGLGAALSGAGYKTGEAKGAAEGCRWIEQQAAGTPFFSTIDLALPVSGRDPKFDALYAQARLDSVNYEPVSPKAAANHEVFKATLPHIRQAAAAVSALDTEVQQVLDCVRRKAFADTLVIFTSSNGALWGRHGLWGDAMASNPPNQFEEVVQVPLLLNWPARVPPASVRPELVSARDLLPTLAELAGASASGNGRSFATPAMNRPLPKKQPWKNLVFSGIGNTRMVRDNRYKLVSRDQGKGPNELYDLAADAREKLNQYENPQFVTVRSRLEGELK